MTRVDGGSAEQQSLLREIVARVGSRGISRLVIREFDRPPEGDPPATEPVGAELACEGAGDPRAQWIVELVGEAFVSESRRRQLPEVVWLSTRDWGRNVTSTPSPVPPLSSDDLSAMRARIEASVGDGSFEHFEAFQPLGHAVTITVRVDEPHAYLRHEVLSLLTAAAEWRERCDGIYIEILDAQPTPVLGTAWRRSGGGSSTRTDVQCCAPQLSLGRPVMWEPPRCPVFG